MLREQVIKNQREDDESYKALCNRVKEYMKYILEN